MRYYQNLSADMIYEMMRDEGAKVTAGIPFWGSSGRCKKCYLLYPEGRTIRVQYSAVRAAELKGYIKKAIGMFGSEIWVLNVQLEVIP